MISMGPVALILVVSGNCSYCTSPQWINPTFSSFFCNSIICNFWWLKRERKKKESLSLFFKPDLLFSFLSYLHSIPII